MENQLKDINKKMDKKINIISNLYSDKLEGGLSLLKFIKIYQIIMKKNYNN